MGRRKNSLLDDLAEFPWWVNVALAIVVYVALKYLLPAMEIQNPFLKGISISLPNLAPIFAGILLFLATISAYNTWRKRVLLERQTGRESIISISWREFEELVGEAYRRKGYHVSEIGGQGADGGIDLVLRKDNEKVLVQCKQWKSLKVGVKTVRELFGVVTAEKAIKGILVTSGRYTEDAKDFALDKPLELVDGAALARMIGEVKQGKSPINVSAPQKNPNCPKCGNSMVLRTARKGGKTGERFWGCSSFPQCRGTIPYNT